MLYTITNNFFLVPKASFVAAIFGMNIKEITPNTHGSLPHYFETAIPLTIVTIWIIIAFQSKQHLGGPESSLWVKLWWPIRFFGRPVERFRRKLTVEKSEADRIA